MPQTRRQPKLALAINHPKIRSAYWALHSTMFAKHRKPAHYGGVVEERGHRGSVRESSPGASSRGRADQDSRHENKEGLKRAGAKIKASFVARHYKPKTTELHRLHSKMSERVHKLEEDVLTWKAISNELKRKFSDLESDFKREHERVRKLEQIKETRRSEIQDTGPIDKILHLLGLRRSSIRTGDGSLEDGYLGSRTRSPQKFDFGLLSWLGRSNSRGSEDPDLETRDLSREAGSPPAPRVPIGWTAEWSRTKQRFYYVNEVTRESVWDLPQAAPMPSVPPFANRPFAEQAHGSSTAAAFWSPTRLPSPVSRSMSPWGMQESSPGFATIGSPGGYGINSKFGENVMPSDSSSSTFTAVPDNSGTFLRSSSGSSSSTANTTLPFMNQSLREAAAPLSPVAEHPAKAENHGAPDFKRHTATDNLSGPRLESLGHSPSPPVPSLPTVSGS